MKPEETEVSQMSDSFYRQKILVANFLLTSAQTEVIVFGPELLKNRSAKLWRKFEHNSGASFL